MLLLGGVFGMSFRCTWFKLFKSSISILICVDVPLNIKSRVLKSPTVTVYFSSVDDCFIYFGVLLFVHVYKLLCLLD